MKKIENLTWRQMHVSHLGCIKGCLEFLGIDVSPPWLFGATGHAFVINVHETACPSGPTAWNTEMLFALGKNIGYNAGGYFCMKSSESFEDFQEKSWQMVQKSIDGGTPCFGWELAIPEYYVVNGYDETGYLFSGPGAEEGGPEAKPWRELGDSGIGVLEMFTVDAGEAVDDSVAVKEALSFGLAHASTRSWIFPKYSSGVEGFETLIRGIKDDVSEPFGFAYNIAVWTECREMAVLFLKEAKERTGLDGLYNSAVGHYEATASALRKVADAFPFHGMSPEHLKDSDLRAVAIEELGKARDTERAGLNALEATRDAL